MSNPASIPHLLRIHFANVGHPDARLSPLTLNFQRLSEMGVSSPIDSVIWAENGVGKSSIRTLLFSLLYPGVQGVMKAANGPLDNRRYEMYFGEKDSSFVITEWFLPPEQMSLAGFEEEAGTLVLGFVAYWPNGQRSSLGDLHRHFFMFRPEGMVSFDRLPVPGLASKIDSVGNAKSFMEWFKKHAPQVAGRHTTIHREWSRWLTETGLDPMIFSYQLRMNGGQGGILGLFKNRINSASDFVHFFLETVLNQDIASDVVDVLNEKKRHIEQKPRWEAEVAFVNEAMPMLEKLRTEKKAFVQQERQIEEDHLLASRFVAGLKQAEIERAQSLIKVRNRLEDSRLMLEERQRRFGEYQEFRSWLRYHESSLNLADAEKQVSFAREAHKRAGTALNVLKAAKEYEAWQVKLGENAAIEAELKNRKNSNFDVEISLYNAGAAFAQVLKRDIGRAELERDSAKQSLAEAKKALAADQKKLHKIKESIAKIKESIRSINLQMQQREKVLHRLAVSGALVAGQAPRDAIEGWVYKQRKAQKVLETGSDTKRQFEMERRRLQVRRHDRTIKKTKLQAELEQLQSVKEKDEKRKTALKNDADLRFILEGETVSLADPDLPGHIKEKIFDLQQKAFRLRRVVADDSETLEMIERSTSKLYPPPKEVRKLLAQLREDLNLNVFLGTEELDRRFPYEPEQAELLFTQDPARYMGLMVQSRGDLEKIRAFESQILKPAFPIQISYAGGALSDLPGQDTFVLRPGHQAAFNRKAAADLIEPLKAEIAAKRLESEHCSKTIKRLEQTLDRLQIFLMEYPNGTLESLLVKIESREERLAELEEEQRTEDEKAADIEEQFFEFSEISKEAEVALKESESSINRLTDFIEDHENRFEHLQIELIEAREALHEQEDESLKLEATIEEDHLLLVERQELLFASKNALEQKEIRLIGVRYTGGEIADITNLTFAEAEQTYQLNLDRYLKVNEKDETLRARLEEKQKAADAQERRFRLQLGALNEADVLQALKEGNLEDRLVLAAQEEKLAVKGVGGAEGALEIARVELREAPTINLDYRLPLGEIGPEDIAGARKKRQEVDETLGRWREAIDTLKDLLVDLKEQERQIQDTINLRCFKREELEAHLPDFETVDAEPLPLPSDNDKLKLELEKFWEAFRMHRKLHSESKIRLDRCCENLKGLASDVRFHNYANDKRELLKTTESLMRVTDEIAKEFEIFRSVVQDSLRLSEASMDSIITRLDAGVSDALYLLSMAESSSRLPNGMEGWSGSSFFKIETMRKTPSRVEDRKPVYERVIRETLQFGKAISGLNLVKRSVDALAGEKGFKVVIMKPGYQLKNDYHPITSVKSWSDGEKITAVILLYCALVQLRALSTGSRSMSSSNRTLSNGMLFLDNPFGEANSLTFVKMQLAMARALNIQLIYTASGSHKHLMARFPRVIRLSQESGAHSNKTFVKATDVGHEVREHVNVTAAHFGRRATTTASP